MPWVNGNISPYCVVHSCQIADCDQVRSLENFYCARHNCSEPSCVDRTPQGEAYCREHGCSVPNCQAAAFEVAYCGLHRCKFLDCQVRERESGFCREHERVRGIRHLTPDEQTCKFIQYTCQTEADNNHAVGYPVTCRKIVRQQDRADVRCTSLTLDGSHYCEEHECQIMFCHQPKVDGSMSCDVHKCAVCKWSRSNAYTGLTLELSLNNPIRFCDEHGCVVDGCRERRDPDSQRCIGHKYCSVGGCMEAATAEVDDRPVCALHRVGLAYAELGRHGGANVWDYITS